MPSPHEPFPDTEDYILPQRQNSVVHYSKVCRRLAAMGQYLPKVHVRVRSALPLIATQSRTSRDVSSGPFPDQVHRSKISPSTPEHPPTTRSRPT
jgi:hypothetical protein